MLYCYHVKPFKIIASLIMQFDVITLMNSHDHNGGIFAYIQAVAKVFQVVT